MSGYPKSSVSCSKKSSSKEDDAFLAEEPDYDYLGLAFEDDNGEPQKTKAGGGDAPEQQQFTQYILGTLLVRLVSARDVPPVPSSRGGNAGGLMGSLIQTVNKGPGGGNSGGRAAPNPYAKVQFLGQMQRTSQMYDTFDPTWPRSEEYYFDVSLPVPSLALEQEEGGGDKDKSKVGNATKNNASSSTANLPPCPQPILTVWLMHSEKRSSGHKKSLASKSVTKDEQTDEQPVLLGMASIDLRPVITGKSPVVDRWIPLTGASDGNENNEPAGEIRLLCEYEPTDPPPRAGDSCRLTGFCRPSDLFPVPPSDVFLVDNVLKKNDIVLSYTSPEGWVCTFTVHRYMVICAVRHQAALELYHDQIVEIADKLAHSPLVDVAVDVVQKRVPEDGLVNVGVEGAMQGVALLSRWFDGGLDTVIGDVVYATNWDGGHKAGGSGGGGQEDGGDGDEEEGEEDEFIEGHKGSKEDVEGPDEVAQNEAAPGMPPCPITGQPMRDPVVAADGHTYERTAITRWMVRSDISPLTGERLAHKEVVPNYLLLSSLAMTPDIPERKKAAAGTPEKTVVSPLVSNRSSPNVVSARLSLTPVANQTSSCSDEDEDSGVENGLSNEPDIDEPPTNLSLDELDNEGTVPPESLSLLELGDGSDIKTPESAKMKGLETDGAVDDVSSEGRDFLSMALSPGSFDENDRPAHEI